MAVDTLPADPVVPDDVGPPPPPVAPTSLLSGIPATVPASIGVTFNPFGDAVVTDTQPNAAQITVWDSNGALSDAVGDFTDVPEAIHAGVGVWTLPFGDQTTLTNMLNSLEFTATGVPGTFVVDVVSTSNLVAAEQQEALDFSGLLQTVPPTDTTPAVPGAMNVPVPADPGVAGSMLPDTPPPAVIVPQV